MTALTRLNAHRPLRWAALLVALAGSVAVYVLLSRPAPLPPDVCDARAEHFREWGRRLPLEFFRGSPSIALMMAKVPFDKGNVQNNPFLILKSDGIWINGEVVAGAEELNQEQGLPESISVALRHRALNSWSGSADRKETPRDMTLFISRDVPWSLIVRVLNGLVRASVSQVDFATIRSSVEPPRHTFGFDLLLVKQFCHGTADINASSQNEFEMILPECSPARLMLEAAEGRCYPGIGEGASVAESLTKLLASCHCAVDEEQLRLLLWHYYRMDESSEQTEYSIRVGGRAKLSEHGQPARPVVFPGNIVWGDLAASFAASLELNSDQAIRALDE